MYLNITDDEQIRKEYELFAGGDDIKISINAKKHGKSFLPDPDGKIVLWAKFRKMTVENYWFIEKLMKFEVERDKHVEVEYDMEEGKRQILRFQLTGWNLPLELRFDENDYLTEDCLKEVLHLPAPLVGVFVDKFIDTYTVSYDEQTEIDKQCASLFARNSRGVENACEAVTLFCVLGNMWEKFGINRFQLKNLPYKEYVMMRMVLSREIDKQRAEVASRKRKGATKIAGAGGKVRPSKGVTVEG